MARQMMQLKLHPVLLQRRITERNLTHRTLAAKVGCSRITITRLANGGRHTVGRLVAEAIEKELDWKSGDLFVQPSLITDSRESDDQESGVSVPVDTEPDAA